MSPVVVDDYPTRVQNEPQIFQRPDPVVWGEAARRNADVAWRYWITDDPTVSAYRRHPRAD